MPIDISELPRSAVQRWLRVVRIPFTAFTAIARRTKDETWPPALAFDAFEAQVKGLAGAVLHDDKLRESSEIGRERIARLRDAESLEAAAGQRREQADRELSERRKAAEQRATESKEHAAASKQRLDAQETATKQRVRERAAAEKRDLDQAAQATQERIDADAKAARQQQLKAERAALAERKKAVKAKAEALKLSDAKQATRQRRKEAS